MNLWFLFETAEHSHRKCYVLLELTENSTDTYDCGLEDASYS